jgi:chaperonin GroES
MPLHAANNYVHVKRDVAESEKNGLILPASGKIKPHTGKITSAGSLVRDNKIKNGKGKTALFHPGVGQEIEYNGDTFLILEDIHILGVE